MQELGIATRRYRSAKVRYWYIALLITTLFLTLTPRANAEWQHPVCEDDGNVLLGTAFCTPPGAQPQPAPDEDSCVGAAYCELTYAQLDAAGHSSADLVADDALPRSVAVADLAGGSSGTEYSGWVDFYLYNNKNCSGTIKYSNYCGWTYHNYQKIVNDNPSGSVVVTAYPARSGNNQPADKWVEDVGPIPNRYENANGVEKQDFRWGRMNGEFTGYEADERDSFFPGKWRLDNWVIYKPSDPSVDRGAFEIHGGENSNGTSKLWDTVTQGCIRLGVSGIKGLKSKWNNRTSNQKQARVYVRHK